MKRRGLVWAGALLLSGCVLQDAVHTIYLEADGTVLWSVSQTVVRSDQGERSKREDEERNFLTQAWAGDTEVAKGLRALGAYGVETRVLRDQRPYVVTTDGHFRSVEAVLHAMKAAVGPSATVDVTTQGPITRFRLVLRDHQTEPRDAGAEPDPQPEALFNGDRYRFALTHGRFLDSRGFLLSSDHTLATPLKIDPNAETITYELAWTVVDTDEPAPGPAASAPVGQ